MKLNYENKKRQRDIHKRNMNILVHDSFRHEKHKYVLRELEFLEDEEMKRTISVSNVKDMKKDSNVTKLEKFFSAYGNVEKCIPLTNRNAANVTFQRRETAESFFDMPLMKASVEKRSESIQSVLARGGSSGEYMGFLKIEPARKIIIKGDDPLSFTFSASSVSLGHWVPEDYSDFFLDRESLGKENSSRTEFLEEFRGFSDSHVTINLRKREVKIIIPHPQSQNPSKKNKKKEGKKVDHGIDACGKFKFHSIVFRLKQLQSVIDIGKENKNNYSILFHSVDAPTLFHVTEIKKKNENNHYCLNERLTQIAGAPFDRPCLGFKISLSRFDAEKIVSYRTEFSKKLSDFGIIRGDIRDLKDCTPIITVHLRYDMYEKELKSSLCQMNNWKLGWLTRSIIDKGKVSWYDMLLDRVEEEGVEYDIFQLCQRATYDEARAALEFLSQMPRPTRYPSKLAHQFLCNNDSNLSVEGLIPSFCMEIPRVLVTPTKIIVQGFDIEISNRVIRNGCQFGLTANDFLRLTIGDENGDKLFPEDYKAPQVSQKLKDLMIQGVCINGTTFKFLAYSSSQMKEGSVWMVNSPPCSGRIKKIREWMGDFSTIKTTSKYAARMGQCFSTTVETHIGVKSNDVSLSLQQSFNMRGWSMEGKLRVNDTLEDILVHGNEAKCHSDGTGLIRKSKFNEVLQHVPFVDDPNDISIIQIRFGGAKGTLTAWDFEALSHLKKSIYDSDVCLRPSMIKFNAPYENLEIISVGKHAPYYLNRQVISLLVFHGVPQSTIQNMQRKMIDDLDGMLLSDEKASEMLPRLSGPDNSTTLSLLKMVHSGFSPKEEPFLFSCLHAIRARHLINLRVKSRIFVKKGAVLVGGIDESLQVPEGCVFLQVRSDDSRSRFLDRTARSPFKVITGPVLVTKHPVMHPGDLRMLLAVDIPELRHHKNVLLFSQLGEYPEASKMSGSDLDGDEFAVTWDERLFIGKWNNCERLEEDGLFKGKDDSVLEAKITNVQDLEKENFPHMIFDAEEIEVPSEKISNVRLAECFINFAKADNLGRISMMWLDYASKMGSAACEQCLKLAELHSVAVDFGKSGIPAKIPSSLIIDGTEPRPHWREKKGASYKCNSILGKLYDYLISRSRKENLRLHAAATGRLWNKQGQLLCFTDTTGGKKLDEYLNKIYKEEIAEMCGLLPSYDMLHSHGLDVDAVYCFKFAKRQRDRYENVLISLMNKYEIHSEGELLTGCIIKLHHIQKRRDFDVAHEVQRQCLKNRSNFRKAFFREVMKCINIGEIEEDDVEDCIYWVERASTTEFHNLDEEIWSLISTARTEKTKQFYSVDDLYYLRRCAQMLAAAYYAVTYDPKLRLWDILDEEEENIRLCLVHSLLSITKHEPKESATHALFSFPWIIADVLCACIHEEETCTKQEKVSMCESPLKSLQKSF